MIVSPGKLTTDRKAALGFLIAFAMLAMVPLFVFENRGRMLSDSGGVSHTQDVIANLESVMLSLADAESGQRGYVITGREQFLEHYEAAVLAAGDAVAQVKALTGDNPSQQARADKLKPLVHRKLDRIRSIIDQRRSRGYAAAVALVQDDDSRGMMNDVRGLVNEMLADERRLLEQRKEALAATVDHGMNAFWFVTALTFAALGVCYFMVNAYITHRRKAEAALEASAEAARSASIAKSAFLANMSHEIRTPMTAIVGYSDLLLEPGQTQSDQLDCLQTIRRNARHLLELINDVLDLSKIEAGKMTVEQIACDVPQLAAEVVSLMRPRALEKGLRFKLNFASAVPRRATTDPLRLKQILVNLVGNAIKFTESGAIELRVSCTLAPSPLPGSTAGVAAIKFDVIDTGIGISDQQMHRLFEPFQQADETMTRKFGGSGLGLTISQRLAKMLGGEITAISTPLRGSTFTITVSGGEVESGEMVDGLDESILSPPDEAVTPRPPESGEPAVAPTPRIASATLAGARILLAEDGLDNQRLIAAHLRAAGATVVIADNGRIALDTLTSPSSGSGGFDIVLMDMQMPELDGYAATGELRRRGVTLPVIALTAHAMTGDREKCLSAGCTDYLTKPIDKHRLLSTLQGYVAAAARSAPTTATSASPASPAAVPGPAPASAIPSAAFARTAAGSAAPSAARSAAPSPPILRSEFISDPDMAPIIREFVAGLPEQVALLGRHLDRLDRDALRRVAHQLKGSGGGYGFAAITAAAARADRAVIEQSDTVADDVRALIEVVRSVEGYARDAESHQSAREAA